MSKGISINGKPVLLDPKKDKRICGYPEAGFRAGLGVNIGNGVVYTVYLHKIGDEEIFYIYDKKEDIFYGYEDDEYKNYKIITREKLQTVVLEYANIFSKDEITALKSIGISLTEEEAYKNLPNLQKQVSSNQVKIESTKSKDRRLKAIELLSLAQKNLLSKENIKTLQQSLSSTWTAVTYLNRQSEFYWIKLELNGYDKDNKLPGYREVTFQQYDHNDYLVESNKSSYRESIATVFYELRNQKEPDRDGDLNYRIISKVSLNDLLNKLSIRLLDSVNSLLLELESGEVLGHVFDSLKERVNTKLSYQNKRALEELHHSFSQIIENKPQNWSAIALSVRKMMQYIAEEVFPARDEDYCGKDGKMHSVKSNNIKNRLMAFIDSKISEDDKLKIDYFEFIISKIWEISNKGAHANINREDAERLLIDSYIFLDDLFSLK